MDDELRSILTILLNKMDTLATKEDVAALSGRVDTLTSAVRALTSAVDTLTERMNVLTDEVKEARQERASVECVNEANHHRLSGRVEQIADILVRHISGHSHGHACEPVHPAAADAAHCD